MTAPDTLHGLKRQRPEWEPWLAVIEEIVRETASPRWDASVPAGVQPRPDGPPLIAGAMLSVVMLTDNNTRSVAEQAMTTGILVLCLSILFVLFALAATIFSVLGRPGVEIVSRVFGLILASIAVTNLVIAIKLSFALPTG